MYMKSKIEKNIIISLVLILGLLCLPACQREKAAQKNNTPQVNIPVVQATSLKRDENTIPKEPEGGFKTWTYPGLKIKLPDGLYLTCEQYDTPEYGSINGRYVKFDYGNTKLKEYYNVGVPILLIENNKIKNLYEIVNKMGGYKNFYTKYFFNRIFHVYLDGSNQGMIDTRRKIQDLSYIDLYRDEHINYDEYANQIGRSPSINITNIPFKIQNYYKHQGYIGYKLVYPATMNIVIKYLPEISKDEYRMIYAEVVNNLSRKEKNDKYIAGAKGKMEGNKILTEGEPKIEMDYVYKIDIDSDDKYEFLGTYLWDSFHSTLYLVDSNLKGQIVSSCFDSNYGNKYGFSSQVFLLGIIDIDQDGTYELLTYRSVMKEMDSDGIDYVEIWKNIKNKWERVFYYNK